MMQVIYSGQAMPDSFHKSIFLAGPSPRDPEVESWRPKAIRVLEAQGYDGVVFSPEWPDGPQGESDFDYEGQVSWEAEAMEMSDIVLFWVPRNLTDMPAFTTNHEHGEWYKSGKVMLGYPKDAVKMKYLHYKAESEHVPIFHNLYNTILAAMDELGDGARREGVERNVPLFIWNVPGIRETSFFNIDCDKIKIKYVNRAGVNRETVSYLIAERIYDGSEGHCSYEETMVFMKNKTVSITGNTFGTVIYDKKIINW